MTKAGAGPADGAVQCSGSRKDFMGRVEYKGRVFEVTEEGFLSSLESWCDEWVEFVMDSEGIDGLTEEHWKVIRYLQEYYRKHGIAPMIRLLTCSTGYELKHLCRLFPSGPGKGGCKIAGLPKQTGCV